MNVASCLHSSRGDRTRTGAFTLEQLQFLCAVNVIDENWRASSNFFEFLRRTSIDLRDQAKFHTIRVPVGCSHSGERTMTGHELLRSESFWSFLLSIDGDLAWGRRTRNR